MSGILIKGVEYHGEVHDVVVHPLSPLTLLGDYTQVIDGTGLTLLPAFQDDHVHFRDPGLLEKEDLLSGARAAAAGGYAWVTCEPNTRPVIDNAAALTAFDAHVKELDLPIGVHMKCALTLEQRGEALVDIPAILAEVYATDFSSDGEPVVDHALLVQAFRLVGDDYTIHLHCEETPRAAERLTAVLGPGPSMAREPELIRLALTALTEAGVGKLHIQHISLAESVSLLAAAKAQGLLVTGEVAPHHLLLCMDDIPCLHEARDANWKMNPPLRSRDDMMAMRQALADGVIDAIATDHAPHTPAEKARGWDAAPFGVIGLETAFGAVMSLVHAGELPFARLVAAMTGNERSLLFGQVLVDTQAKWTVDPSTFYSKGRNCPFAGREFVGKPIYLFRHGKLVMAEGEVLF